MLYCSQLHYVHAHDCASCHNGCRCNVCDLGIVVLLLALVLEWGFDRKSFMNVYKAKPAGDRIERCDEILNSGNLLGGTGNIGRGTTHAVIGKETSLDE